MSYYAISSHFISSIRRVRFYKTTLANNSDLSSSASSSSAYSRAVKCTFFETLMKQAFQKWNLKKCDTHINIGYMSL